MKKGYFITGTGTDIGKTYITALITKQLKKNNHIAYFKAALSGAEIDGDQLLAGDALYVQKMAHLNSSDIKVSYILETAVSPHLAAKIEHIKIQLDKIKNDLIQLQDTHECVIVEGSGGIICPIYEGDKDLMLENIIKLTPYPLIIVTRSDLGCINEAILTSFYAKEKQIPIKGFIMNHFETDNYLHLDNKRMIEKLSGYPVLGYVEKNGLEIIGNID